MLTPRQQKFAEYYAQCGNVTQAAIQAGYSEKYAKADACKILENPSVADYLRALGIADQTGRILTARRRQELLSALAEDGGVEPRDRIRAIDTLNRMTGEYTLKVDASVQPSAKLEDVFSQLGGKGLGGDD